MSELARASSLRSLAPSVALGILSAWTFSGGCKPTKGSGAVVCMTDADCNDDDPCSEDYCGANGTCQFAFTNDLGQPVCCTDDAACDDGIACTADSCVEGEDGVKHCANDMLDPADSPGCCQVDNDCDDDLQCTEDYCDPATFECVNSMDIESECCVDSDCDDGRQCTIDQCTYHTLDEYMYCVHGPSTEPPCCENDEDCNDADTCTEDRCLDSEDGLQCFNEPFEPGVRPPECSEPVCPFADPEDIGLDPEGDPALDLSCASTGFTAEGVPWVKAEYRGMWYPPLSYYSWFGKISITTALGELGSYTYQHHDGVDEVITTGVLTEANTTMTLLEEPDYGFYLLLPAEIAADLPDSTATFDSGMLLTPTSTFLSDQVIVDPFGNAVGDP